MSHNCDSDSAGQHSEQKVIRKIRKIYTAKLGSGRVPTTRILCRRFDLRVQLTPKLIPKPGRESVVPLQNAVHIFLDKGIVSDPHRPRSCRTRRTNSSWESSSISPASNLRSRSATSSSEISTSAEGNALKSLQTKSAFCSSGNLMASFSISTRLIRKTVFLLIRWRNWNFPLRQSPLPALLIRHTF